MTSSQQRPQARTHRPFVEQVLLGVMTILLSSSAFAIGSLADVQIVDRETGRRLPVYRSGERFYVAGKPGNRYAVEVRNRLGERVLSVMSIDGINAVSGETAGWAQTGYVWSAYECSQITGWRKSMAQVAAFQFAALDNSYAARTGRPDQVGVIGVALFREKMMAPQAQVKIPYAPVLREKAEASRAAGDGASGSAGPGATSAAETPAPASAGLAEMESKARRDRASEQVSAAGNLADKAAPAAMPETRLGTAHGQIETARISYTDFERRGMAPDEVIAIYYDSAANLIAQGIIPVPIARNLPQPFPGNAGFVPDPPRW